MGELGEAEEAVWGRELRGIYFLWRPSSIDRCNERLASSNNHAPLPIPSLHSSIYCCLFSSFQLLVSYTEETCKRSGYVLELLARERSQGCLLEHFLQFPIQAHLQQWSRGFLIQLSLKQRYVNLLSRNRHQLPDHPR